MPGLSDALRELLEEHGDTDAEAFAEALKEARQPFYQAIYQRGFSTAHERGKETTGELEQRLQAAESELEEAREKIANLQEEKPDVGKLNADWEAKLEREREKAEEKVKGMRTELERERRSAARSDLLARLKGRLDPDYAEVMAERHMARVRHREGRLEVVEQEGSEVPVQAGRDQSPLDVLASEIVEGANPKFRLSNGDRGSGTGNGSAGTAGPSRWDRIREKAKADRESQHSGWSAPASVTE